MNTETTIDRALAVRAGALALAAALTNCSGSSTPMAVPHTTPSTAATAQAGSGASSSAKMRIKMRLLIPHAKPTWGRAGGLKRAEIALAKRMSALSGRRRMYVSPSTLGIGIVSTQNGSPIDSVSFSTNASDNPNCSVDQSSGNTVCTFTIGAEGPYTTFAISAYASEPNQPTGGSATNFPANLTPLSSATDPNVPIANGTTNTVTINLGGVAGALAVEALNPNYPNTNNNDVLSLQGQGAVVSIPFIYTVLDAAGNTITAGQNDPLATPVTFSVAEANGSGDTMLVLNSTDANGNPTTSAPAQSVTSTLSSDSVVVVYNGAGTANAAGTASAYYATITTSTAAYTDPISGTDVPAISQAFSLSPLFVVGNANGATDASFAAGNGTTLPLLTATADSVGNSSYPTLELDGALASTQPNDTGGAPPVDDQLGGSPCTAFGVKGPNGNGPGGGALYNTAVITNSPNSAECQFALGDGTGAAQAVDLQYAATTGTGTITRPAPPGPTFNPAGGLTLNGDEYSSQALFVSGAGEDVGYGSNFFPMSACSATNSSCYAYNNAYYTYCLNASGGVYVDYVYDGYYYDYSGQNYEADSFSGDYSEYGSSATGNIGCTVTFSDANNHSSKYTITATF